MEDSRRFQRNLDSLGTWSERWGMSFNSSKSKIIGFNSNDEVPEYTLNVSILDHVNSVKYLGVMLQSD